MIENDSEISLRLFDDLRRRDGVIFLTCVEAGWRVNHHGSEFTLNKECHGLDRYLRSDKLPNGIEFAFSKAWSDLSNGIDKEIVQDQLQFAVDMPMDQAGRR